MKKFTHIIFTLIISLLANTTILAGNYSWTGATNTDWATGTNWNPNGIPSTNDTVTLLTNTNLPVLAGNTSIKKFTMTSGTLDCNGYSLTISATATFNGGTINNGTVTCSGTSILTFAGTTFGAAVNATGNNILFNGSVFNSTVTAVKKGSSSDNGNGGNVFNGAVTLTDSGTGNLVLSNNSSAPDTFNAALTVSAVSSGGVYLAHQGTGNVFNGDVTFSTGNVFSNTYGTASYNGNITLNSASGNISFGNSTGSWTLASGKNITIGTFSAGTLTIRNLTQSDNSINMRLVLSGTGKLVLGGNSISAKLYASSNQLTFSGSRFLSADTLIYIGGNNATSTGGNYFGSTVYIANTYTGTNYHFILGSTSVDTFTTTTTLATTGNTSIDVEHGLFLGAVTFKNAITSTGSDRFYVQDCTFKGALTLDGVHSGINFRAGSGNTVLDSTATLSLVSGYAGQLTLSSIEQRGSNAISLNISTNTSSGNSILTIGPNATFNGSFTYLGQRLELNGGTFNSDASFTRFSQSLDVCTGGNVFNGTTLICDSVAATTSNRVFKLANTTADDYNASVTFKQYGTGTGASTMKMYPAYAANSTFAGNVTVESNTVPIEFGAGGGKVILDGNANDTIRKTGSYGPAIKKLELKKTGGLAILNLSLSISDSIIFTTGYLKTDSVNLLTIADNCIANGAGDYSAVAGPIKKVGNDAFTFPFAERWTGPPPVFAVADYVYHPLTISAPSNTTDAFTAQYFSANHNKGTNADSTIENESTCEYWKLERNTGSSNVTIKLGWNWNSCNVYGMDSMRVAVWDTATSKWKDKGNGGTTGNLTTGTVVSSSAISTFGIMTLADKFCTTLKPVTTATDVTCPGNQDGKANVTASGATPPYTYNWSPRAGGSSSLWDINAGTYHVAVTDSRGCVVMDSVSVNDSDSILFTINATSSQCHSAIGSAKVIPIGEAGYFYFWDRGGETSDSIGGLVSGLYELIVSDSNGCSVDTIIAISDSDGPDVTADSVINVDCHGSNTGLIKVSCPDCTEGFTSVLPCGSGIGSLSELEAGTYPVTVNDQGCQTIINVIITEPPPISLAVSTNSSQCGDSTGSAIVTATGGTGAYTYHWSSGDTLDEAQNLSAGFDTVVVRDANGCYAFKTVFIENADGPALSFSKTDNLCFDGHAGQATVLATGNSPFSYFWFPTGDTSAVIDSISFGDYIVLVTDSTGCMKIDTVRLENPTEIQVKLFTTNPSSDSASDGSAHVEVMGGSPPYNYVWSTGGTTSSVDDLAEGNYTVSITDLASCTRTLQFNLLLAVPCNPGTGCYGVDYLPGCNVDPCGAPHNCYSMMIAPYNVAPYNTFPDFGADPNPNLSAVDECAFESADQYLRNFVCGNLPPGQKFTLYFPPGQYDVGRQTPFGANGNLCFYSRGHNIFVLSGCENIMFKGIPDPNTGELPKIRYIDCLRYGSFVPLDDPVVADRGKRFLPCGSFCDTKFFAFPGDLFDIYNSGKIYFQDLEFDGNLPNLNVGGANSSDGSGIIGGHTGIEVYDRSHSIFLNNVNIHDFGYVGFGVHPENTLQSQPNVHIVLSDSKFNRNGCCGLAWESGSSLRALRCQFNENAIHHITTFEASGIDIESEGYAAHPSTYQAASHGFFSKCEFKLNYRTGVQNTFQPNLTVSAAETDFDFKDCIFVGHASGHDALKNGNPIAISARRTHFTCCTFVGPINYSYDARINFIQFPNNDQTIFRKCFFNEEYTVGGTPYSFTPDCFVDCANWNATVPHHQYMIHLGTGLPAYSRQLFDQCYFKTGYNNQFCRLSGSQGLGLGPLQAINCQIINNSHFINTGLNGFPGTFTPAACNGYNVASSGASGNYMFFQFAYVNFTGVNRLNYNRWSGCNASFGNIRNNNNVYDYSWGYNDCFKNGVLIPNMATPSAIIPSYYGPGCVATGAFNKPFDHVTINDDSQFTLCRDRFPDAAPKFDLFSCPPAILDGLNCSGMRKIKPDSPNLTNVKSNLEISPNPASDFLLISNLNLGERIEIYDMLGRIIFLKETTTSSLQIDITNLPSGIYMVKANEKIPQKFIKSDTN